MVDANRMIIKENEIPLPTVFTDFSGGTIKVYGKVTSDQTYKCPRDGAVHTDEVSTSRGVWLYCYSCGIFYSPFDCNGWGYKQ